MGVGHRPWLLRGLVLGLALVVGFVAWLSTGGDDEEAAPFEAVEPRIVTVAELEEIAADAGHPVYWAGPIAGTALELGEEADGSLRLRYLDDAADLGKEPAAFLTVATYPMEDPQAAIERFGSEPESVVREGHDGRTLVNTTQSPTNFYFADPENTVQVEVYDISPKRALALSLSEQVRPID